MADWDERYARGEHAGLEPSRLLVKAVEHLTPGRALDVASGAGRHALFLAERGWHVTAVERSRVGIELTRERADERGLTVETHVADLERGEFKFDSEAFDLVCVFYYLQRDLFPSLRASVRPGGRFVAAIHVEDASDAPPRNPAFLLKPGELRAEFEDWQIEYYREGRPADDEHKRSAAEIIAVKKRRQTVAE